MQCRAHLKHSIQGKSTPSPKHKMFARNSLSRSLNTYTHTFIHTYIADFLAWNGHYCLSSWLPSTRLFICLHSQQLPFRTLSSPSSLCCPSSPSAQSSCAIFACTCLNSGEPLAIDCSSCSRCSQSFRFLRLFSLQGWSQCSSCFTSAGRVEIVYWVFSHIPPLGCCSDLNCFDFLDPH